MGGGGFLTPGSGPPRAGAARPRPAPRGNARFWPMPSHWCVHRRMRLAGGDRAD